MRKKYILSIFLFLFTIINIYAQAPSTEGKQFWVTFMKNGYRGCNYGGGENISLKISSKKNCSGTITNPNTTYSVNFNVTAGGLTSVDIPATQAYNELSEVIMNTGLFISATDTISVYAANEATNSFDASFVLPLETLEDEYIVQNYVPTYNDVISCPGSNKSVFSIIATENNTTVEITPKVATANGKPANVTFSVTLQKGKVYQVISATSNTSGDFSGSHIKAQDGKKIAVFMGNVITTIPVEADNGYDHIFEQAVAPKYWGKNFAITSSAIVLRDYVRITASMDNTQIKKNGAVVTTINARETYSFDITSTEGSCFVETSNPCAVCLYQKTGQYEPNDPWNYLGDPSMVWISPTEQIIKNITFGTYDIQNIVDHYVNVISNTNDVSSVTLNGVNISSYFSPVNGTSDYWFARVPLTHGSHTLTSDRGITAHVYGLGYVKGYAYSVGASMLDLNQSMYVNDIHVETLPPNTVYCSGQTINFRAEVAYSYVDVKWNMGDGTATTGNQVTHTYSNIGTYTVDMWVRWLNNYNTLDSTLTSYTFRISSPSPPSSFTANGCEQYIWNGQTYTTSGAHVQTLTNKDGCDSIVTMHLTIYPKYEIDQTRQSCGPYMWNGQLYNQTGTYTLPLTSVHGCDSILTLHLTVFDEYFDTRTVSACGSYPWGDVLLTTSGTYTNTFTNQYGCDSTITLNLTILEQPIHEINVSTCVSHTWNGVVYDVTGVYSQVFTAANGCDSTVYLKLSIYDSYDIEIDDISCGVYNWNGQVYTSSGRYTQYLIDQKGC
ncbi:MAG: PKD domain-containing protein, partial [Bacteroidales bacterium]|nr:PKD domain-containing protein [Bacteroidales bacterium]